MNKDIAITYLKEMNKGKEAQDIVTRLYYGNEGEHVQDFSCFANEQHMSPDLLSALQSGQTLTTEQEKELNMFVVEKAI